MSAQHYHAGLPALLPDGMNSSARSVVKNGSGNRYKQDPFQGTLPVGIRSLTVCTKREVSRMQDSPVSQTHFSETCAFCQIIRSEEKAYIVFEDGISLAFLDSRPLFPGHCLLVPKDHYETLADLPASLVGPLFQNAQLLERAID